MADLNETLLSDLSARYLKIAGMVHDLAGPLSDQQFWTKPFPFGNSFGHLVLHLTGNLNYYIGAQIAGTGYERDRPREFTEANRPPKEEVMKLFGDTIEMVVRTIRMQSAEDWSKEYSAVGADTKDRLGIVLTCVTHLHHHLGQMMYLSFQHQKKD